MDGLELQERLQAMDSALCVVLISAYADAPLAARAKAKGAVAVIEKPYRDDDLADAIRRRWTRVHGSGKRRRATRNGALARLLRQCGLVQG